MTSIEELKKDIERCTAVLRKYNCLDERGNAKHYKTILTLPLNAKEHEEVTAAKEERARLLDKLCSKKAHKRKQENEAPDAKRAATAPHPALEPLPPHPAMRHGEHYTVRFLPSASQNSSLSVSTAPPALQSSSTVSSSTSGLSLLALAASSSSSASVKAESPVCKWCGEEECRVCTEMQGEFPDSEFLQLVVAIAAHLRDPHYAAPSYIKSTMRFYDVCKKAEMEDAKEFFYSSEQHAMLLKEPCDYCGAASAGKVVCAERGSYSMENMSPLCAFCERLKGSISDKVFTEKCTVIDKHRRRCPCDAPRFLGTGMCASAYLYKKCESPK